MAKRYITTREAAELTGYNVEHIRARIRKGDIKAMKIASDWLVDRASLARYIRDHGRLKAERLKW